MAPLKNAYFFRKISRKGSTSEFLTLIFLGINNWFGFNHAVSNVSGPDEKLSCINRFIFLPQLVDQFNPLYWIFLCDFVSTNMKFDVKILFSWAKHIAMIDVNNSHTTNLVRSHILIHNSHLESSCWVSWKGDSQNFIPDNSII